MLILCGFTEDTVYRGSHEQRIHRRELPKKGGFGQFADLRGRLGKKEKRETGVLLSGIRGGA